MKTVLVIGKMNELMKDLNSFLKNYFRVQLCADHTENAIGMLKVVEPDIVLVSLVGFSGVDRSLFSTLTLKYEELPVLTIGTEKEKDPFSEFYKTEQFHHLLRPLENAVVLDAICENLGISRDEIFDEEPEVVEEQTKVLVVDDNVSILRGIKGMLEEDYKVALANSGMKAMTMIGKERPDIILLDYEMPVVDGKQTLEMIRGDEELKDIPVIFLTGVNDKEHIQAVLALRPARYLLKPAVKEKIIDAIEKVLHG